MMHENMGPGVSHDEAEAAAWYAKAATQGHGGAMFFLGIQYWAGRGVPQDFVEAYKWLDLSATYSKSPQSRKQAADARDSVARAKAMSPQRVALGQAQARAWREQFERRQEVGRRSSPSQLGLDRVARRPCHPPLISSLSL
jgi:hypothetical protein